MSSFTPPPLPRDIRAHSDDATAVTAFLTSQGVGDGHPVIPPTDALVEDMLVGWTGAESLGTIAPLGRAVTTADVAVCAVLAGCPRAAMPVLCAAVRAVQEPSFNLLGVSTTTGSAAVGLVLHGAVVDDLRANAGANYLGPGNVANATIGRAFATLLRVVGGAVPGVIDVAISGQPAKYGLCFAELPARPGWPGLHEERGYATAPGAVTVIAISGTIEVVDAHSQDVVDLLDTLGAAMVLPVSGGSDGTTLGSGEPIVVVPPEWVRRLSENGWTKRQVRERLWERAVAPVDRLAYGIRARSDAAGIHDQLRVAASADDIVVLVAGGPGTKAQLMPTWSTSRTVTVPVGRR